MRTIKIIIMFVLAMLAMVALFAESDNTVRIEQTTASPARLPPATAGKTAMVSTPSIRAARAATFTTRSPRAARTPASQ